MSFSSILNSASLTTVSQSHNVNGKLHSWQKLNQEHIEQGEKIEWTTKEGESVKI